MGNSQEKNISRSRSKSPLTSANPNIYVEKSPLTPRKNIQNLIIKKNTNINRYDNMELDKHELQDTWEFIGKAVENESKRVINLGFDEKSFIQHMHFGVHFKINSFKIQNIEEIYSPITARTSSKLNEIFGSAGLSSLKNEKTEIKSPSTVLIKNNNNQKNSFKADASKLPPKKFQSNKYVRNVEKEINRITSEINDLKLERFSELKDSKLIRNEIPIKTLTFSKEINGSYSKCSSSKKGKNILNEAMMPENFNSASSYRKLIENLASPVSNSKFDCSSYNEKKTSRTPNKANGIESIYSQENLEKYLNKSFTDFSENNKYLKEKYVKKVENVAEERGSFLHLKYEPRKGNHQISKSREKQNLNENLENLKQTMNNFAKEKFNCSEYNEVR